MGRIVPDAIEHYLAGLNRAGDPVLDAIALGNATRGLPLVDAEVGAPVFRPRIRVMSRVKRFFFSERDRPDNSPLLSKNLYPVNASKWRCTKNYSLCFRRTGKYECSILVAG